MASTLRLGSRSRLRLVGSVEAPLPRTLGAPSFGAGVGLPHLCPVWHSPWRAARTPGVPGQWPTPCACWPGFSSLHSFLRQLVTSPHYSEPLSILGSFRHRLIFVMASLNPKGGLVFLLGSGEQMHVLCGFLSRLLSHAPTLEFRWIHGGPCLKSSLVTDSTAGPHSPSLGPRLSLKLLRQPLLRAL